MVSKLFRECLMDVYLGEHAGETAFELMLAAAENEDQRYILGTLLQAETEGKAFMRPLISRLGLPLLDENSIGASGASAAEQLNTLPWRERFASMSDFVKANYLPRYEELATLVLPDEDPEATRIAQFMGDHERALIALSDNVAQGTEDPAAPVAAILNFPLFRQL
jgi:hypothetical protein